MANYQSEFREKNTGYFHPEKKYSSQEIDKIAPRGGAGTAYLLSLRSPIFRSLSVSQTVTMYESFKYCRQVVIDTLIQIRIIAIC